MSPKILMLFIDSYQEDMKEDIDLIISSMKKDYDDIGIICDDNSDISSKYATIPSIYLRFFKGDVVFLSLSSYLEHENILADNIFIKTTIDELLSSNVTRAKIGSSKIISINDFNLEVIDYATI
jgi:hypothetical protein